MRRVIVGLGALVVAASLATGVVRAGDPSVGMLVLIDGCDGFVAEGGLLPLQDFPTVPPPPQPWPWSWTHNFDIADETETKLHSPGEAGSKWSFRYTITGSGTDAAGHGFTVSARLELDWARAGNPATSGEGTATIRRDDGARVTGYARRTEYQYNSPLFEKSRALRVTAKACKL